MGDGERLLLVLKALCLLTAFIGGRQLGMLYAVDVGVGLPTRTACPPSLQAAVVYIDDHEPCPAAGADADADAGAGAGAHTGASTSARRLPATHPNSYFRRPVHADDSCPPTADPAQLQTRIHKNSYRRLELEGMGLHADGALKDVFGYLHHPSCPVYAEPVLVSGDPSQAAEFSSDFSSCESVYAMRSGSRDDQPCKCVAVVRVPPGEGHVSEMSIMHRTGHIDWPQVLTDQYQDDIVHYYSLAEEKNLTSLFLAHRDELIAEFVRIMGPPIDEHGNVRTALLMVANAGVMDLVLNFLCSTAAAGIDMSSFVIFLGQGEYSSLVRSMGAKSMYHPALGDMPAQSAESYADRTFSRVMWLKVTSVYIALSAGFNVIFQDADLVWIRDPVPFLTSLSKYDMIFMDDGARTPRFSPFFTNTGFYFARRTERVMLMQERLIKSVGEISYTASHQATFIRHLTEAHYAFYLQILVLDDNLFPSGQMYHHQNKYVAMVKNYEKLPYVWHMCWTATRAQKVEHFKDLGLWYLPDPNGDRGDGGFCENPAAMLAWVQGLVQLYGPSANETRILPRCCTRGQYWDRKRERELVSSGQ